MAALTHENFLQFCREFKAAAGELEMARLKMEKVLSSHFDIPYTSVADPPPSWLNLDADGQISGINWTAADYNAGIVLAEQLGHFFGNNPSLTQGDYRRSLNQLIQPERS